MQYPLAPDTAIRRARGWRLYDAVGRRYTDFYQYDGAAFLGHRPASVARVVAAEIDRGLWAPLPSAWSGRFDRGLAAIAELAGAAHIIPIAPGRDNKHLDQTTPRRWYPLSVDPSDDDTRAARERGETASLVIPFPVTLGYHDRIALPSASELGPVVLAGFTRALWSLRRYLSSSNAVDRLALAALLAVPDGYRRRGVYFVANDHVADDLYQRRVTAANRLGIVLPPRADIPFTVPGEIGRAEMRSWEELCDDWPR